MGLFVDFSHYAVLLGSIHSARIVVSKPRTFSEARQRQL
eukprot:COSAG05_NODE_1889_length_3884_cov_112.293999_1_plen_39_part_00